MGIVVRPEDHNFADPNTARGAGETSLYNPNRSNLDYSAALGRVGETATEAGGMIRKALDSSLEGVVEFIHQVTGVDLSGEAALLEQLLAVPLDALEGSPVGLALERLGAFFSFLNGPGGGDFDPIAAARDFIVNRLLPTGSVLGPDSPLRAGNLIGSIRAELLSVLPAGALTTAAPNRAKNPNFDGPDAIAPAGDWDVDMTTSRTNDGTGSAVVTADGRPHRLRTGESASDIEPVAPGQKVPARIAVMHAGADVAPGGPPVVLEVVPFLDGVELPAVQVDAYTPATSDLPWPGHEMSGVYTVPDTGVNGVQTGFGLTEFAQQGVYHFDEGYYTQQADYNAIPGLPAMLQALDNRGRATWDMLASVARGFPVLNAGLEEVEAAMRNFNPFNLAGLLGEDSLAGDVRGILRSVVGGLRGRPVADDEEVGLADVYNAANQVAGGTAGSDETVYIKATTLVPVDPSWANWLDVVILPRGQAGQNSIIGFFGQGGAAAQHVATTWHKGEHYDDTLTGVQFTLNSDGSIVASIPGHSITAYPATGPQTLQLFGGWQGKAVLPLTYNGKPYVAGGAQNMPGAAAAGPGAGGAGGHGIVIPHGGPGGPAAGWLRARADDVANPSTGVDTTPPSDPTVMEVVAASNNALTLRSTGSVDA